MAALVYRPEMQGCLSESQVLKLLDGQLTPLELQLSELHEPYYEAYAEHGLAAE